MNKALDFDHGKREFKIQIQASVSCGPGRPVRPSSEKRHAPLTDAAQTKQNTTNQKTRTTLGQDHGNPSLSSVTTMTVKVKGKCRRRGPIALFDLDPIRRVRAGVRACGRPAGRACGPPRVRQESAKSRPSPVAVPFCAAAAAANELVLAPGRPFGDAQISANGPDERRPPEPDAPVQCVGATVGRRSGALASGAA